jgi:hypothetical protein
MTTRLKFNVAGITICGNNGGTKIVLFPTMRSEENKEAWSGIPDGKIELLISPDSGVQFDIGEYYVDFTRVEI